MSPDMRQFELERVINLLKTFQWTVRTNRFDGDKVVVAFERMAPGATSAVQQQWLAQIQNMLVSLGWQLVSSSFPGDRISAEFTKTVKSEG